MSKLKKATRALLGILQVYTKKEQALLSKLQVYAGLDKLIAG
jgi:hypothetical protein